MNHFCVVRDASPAEMAVSPPDARGGNPDGAPPDFGPADCPPGAECLPPTDDTYIDQARAETVYGDVPVLRVAAENAGERWALLRFDIGSTRVAPARAWLSLGLSRVKPEGVARDARVHLVAVFWSERAMTWKDRPAVSLPDVARAEITVVPGERQQWDVTSVVRAAVEDGRSQLAFAIQAGEGDGEVVWTFLSREGGKSPWLVFE